MTILLSGATGWLGKAFLRRCERDAFEFGTNEIVGLSNRPKTISTTTKIGVKNFWSELRDVEVDGFIHLAFLTRDKVANMPWREYVETNRRITSRAVDLILQSKPNWVAVVSSGAIFTKESRFQELEKDIERNPYGFLKHEEEVALSKAASEVGSNLAIGRLWGASGRDLPPNPKYALSDFIQSALTTRRIQIRSSGQVFRRYCDASEFMEILIKTAMQSHSKVFNSGGPILELNDLAQEIATQIGSCDIKRNLNLMELADRYYPTDNTYETLADSLEVTLSHLGKQVSETILGHKVVISD